MKRNPQKMGRTGADLYQAHAADLTQALLTQAIHKGLPLPQSPESNPIEKDLVQAYHDEVLQALDIQSASQGHPQQVVMDVKIDPAAVQLQCNQWVLSLAEGTQASQNAVKTHKTGLSEAKARLEAMKASTYINRPLQQGKLSSAIAWTAVTGVLDTSANVALLFSSGFIQHGVLGATALAGLVGAVNTGLGVVFGKLLYRHLLPENKSQWMKAAQYFTLLIALVIVINNGLFAWLRAFGEGSFIANKDAYLSFVGVFALGCVIFGSVAKKWQATQDPNIIYETLHHAVEQEQEALSKAKQQLLAQIGQWSQFANTQLDEWLAAERQDYALAQSALAGCHRLEQSNQNLCQQLKTQYEVAISLHRQAVQSCNLNNTPHYFQEEPVITVSHTPLDLDALNTHVTNLQTQLGLLEQNIQACKQDIANTTNQLIQTLSDTVGETSCV